MKDDPLGTCHADHLVVAEVRRHPDHGRGFEAYRTNS
jgi:hypothetical protein